MLLDIDNCFQLYTTVRIPPDERNFVSLTLELTDGEDIYICNASIKGRKVYNTQNLYEESLNVQKCVN